jgi:hypothetical protein
VTPRERDPQKILNPQFSIRQLATGAMNVPRTALQRVLYTPALNPLAQTALQCSLRRPPSILRLAIRNASSTTIQEQTPQPVVQLAKAEQVYLHYQRKWLMIRLHKMQLETNPRLRWMESRKQSGRCPSEWPEKTRRRNLHPTRRRQKLTQNPVQSKTPKNNVEIRRLETLYSAISLTK